MSYTAQYLRETAEILAALDEDVIDDLARHLAELRGRLFILGVGGSAATASHAVNDFRKQAGIDAICPTDNIAEITARTNDEGWATSLVGSLMVSNIGPEDAVLVLSVGGGTAGGASPNLVRALDYAKDQQATILGIVGRDGGHTARLANACLVIPPLFEPRITAHTEEVAGVVMHLLVGQLCSR